MNNNQYFSKTNDQLESDPKIIYGEVLGVKMQFKTDNGVFSKDELDHATKLLLEQIDFNEVEGDILDIGCGYGPIGIYAKKVSKNNVVMLDVNPRSLNLAKENLKLNQVEALVLESDCLDGVLDHTFGIATLNPPIHAGKQVIYKMYRQAYDVLAPNGLFWIVIQQKHGAPSTVKELETIFELVDIVYKKKGYYIIKCKKLS